MDNKGELYADGDGAMPLRQAYESLGKPINYEALRQYMLTTYFRLTVPAVVERQAQEATERVMGREANQMPQGRDPERREVVHDLLLPRISVLRSHTKQEIAQMEQAERREAEVVDRENNVVGHVRRINPAYRASQMAREEAAKYGITLPPTGMTFVAEHHHPLAGKAGTHRAKERPSGGKKMPGKPQGSVGEDRRRNE